MDKIGFLGFGFASIAYLFFGLLLLFSKSQSSIARWLLISVVITLVTQVVAALQIELGFHLYWVMLADIFKAISWSILILSYSFESKTIFQILLNSPVKKFLSISLSVSLMTCVLILFFNFSSKYAFLLFMGLNLWSLVLIEQLYRNASEKNRWVIWPLVIALGSINVFDFVLYAQASMVGAIDFDFWYLRGFILALAMPLLLISARRNKNDSVRIFISRNVVFYSSMLLISGAYLVLMAITGYVINYLGGNWGSIVSNSFMVLGGLLLAVLLLTNSLRRKVKVFIAKNFFANKYEYRDEWLNLIEKIETSSGESHHKMATTILMSKVKASGGAIVKRQNQNKFHCFYNENITIDKEHFESLELIAQFCQNKSWIIDVDEYIDEPLSYPGLLVHGNELKKANFDFVVPIFIGKVFYGFFILTKSKESEALNWEDRDLIFAVSKQLGNYISLNEVNSALAESKQFDAFNRMSAFLVHDLKNVQAQLALITANATKHRNNPEFVDDVFETVESATERLDKILSQLKNKKVVHSKKAKVDIATLLDDVISLRNQNSPKVSLLAKNRPNGFIDSESFASVVNHLIQNSQEATKDTGWVEVYLSSDSNKIYISIKDNGIGMSQEFVNNRLFKPFDTTKGNAGMGIGAFEAKQLVESLEGSIQVVSQVGKGSEFKLSIPLIEQQK